MDIETLTVLGHGGLQLEGDIAGPRDGPPVALFHGGGQTRHSWRGSVIGLAKNGFRAMAFDLRGHGDSEWSESEDYSLRAYSADIAEILKGLSRPTALVGASLGGMAALMAAGALEPDRVSALILVDIVPRIESAGARAIKAFMRASPEGFSNLEEAANTVAAYLPHRPRPSDPSGLLKNLRRRDDGRLHWHWDPAFMTGIERIDPRTNLQDLETAARGVRCPTLLVRGARSELVTAEGVNALRALIPQAEMIDVKDAHHMVAGDQNRAFDRAVVDFLTPLLSTRPLR